MQALVYAPVGFAPMTGSRFWTRGDGWDVLSRLVGEGRAYFSAQNGLEEVGHQDSRALLAVDILSAVGADRSVGRQDPYFRRVDGF